MEIIKAPFTPEQVEQLNKYQKLGFMHPFTCMGSYCGDRHDQAGDGTLIASTEGWVCPCGKFTQNWAHAFMAHELHNPLKEFMKVARPGAEPSITCLVCGMTSYNPNDIQHRYCANCDLFHDPNITIKTYKINENEVN